MPDLAQALVITETFRMISGLAQAAFNNPLTNLLNRAALVLLAREHDRGATPRFAVAYIDLTGFKSINEKYGHDGGDATLKEMGAALTKLAAEVEGHAYHLSGDEFLILFAPDRQQAFLRLAERVHRVPIRYAEHEFEALANIGVALPEEDSVIDTLRRRAEQACGAAKSQQLRAPLVWAREHVAETVVDRRWRCDTCQATVQVLIPANRRVAGSLRCANCGEMLPD